MGFTLLIKRILYISIYIYIYTHCIRLFSTTFPRIHPGPAFQWLLPLFVTEEPGISLENLAPDLVQESCPQMVWATMFSTNLQIHLLFLKQNRHRPQKSWRLWLEVSFFNGLHLYTYILYIYANYHLQEKAEKQYRHHSNRAMVTSPMRCAGTSTRGSSGS